MIKIHISSKKESSVLPEVPVSEAEGFCDANSSGSGRPGSQRGGDSSEVTDSAERSPTEKVTQLKRCRRKENNNSPSWNYNDSEQARSKQQQQWR